MPESGGEVYTRQHESCATCAQCGKQFVPRNRRGPTTSRFCRQQCKDDYHNARRRRTKNPLAVGAVAAGHDVLIPYHGELLILSRAEVNTALERGRAYARSHTVTDAGEHLIIAQVIERVGYCRASIYSLISHGRFPRPIVLSGFGRQRRVAWQSKDISGWLRRRSKTKARTAEGRPGSKKKQQALKDAGMMPSIAPEGKVRDGA